MVNHKNFYPPAGAVIDSTDSRVTWNGKAWMQGGRVVSVQGHRLVGRPGTSFNGWYYEWSTGSWVEPSPAPTRLPASAPLRPVPRPTPQPMGPNKQPPAPQPERKELILMEKKPHTVLEDLAQHPVAPVVGGMLLVASYVTDEPVPPTIPANLPEETQKQWMMVFNQNQQRFERRMSLYRDLAMVLLGYSSARSIVDVLGPSRALAEKRA